jgi:hypothetical protein
MQLTWRDGAATVLAALVVAVMLALTQAWSWPLLGDYRAGVVALTIIGFGMCATGAGAMQASAFRQPFTIVASLLGVVALGLVVLGLIYATQTLFVALGITLLALWVVTTVDHVLTAPGDRTLRTGA